MYGLFAGIASTAFPFPPFWYHLPLAAELANARQTPSKGFVGVGLRRGATRCHFGAERRAVSCLRFLLCVPIPLSNPSPFLSLACARGVISVDPDGLDPF